jgi:hypothetical protein
VKFRALSLLCLMTLVLVGCASNGGRGKSLAKPDGSMGRETTSDRTVANLIKAGDMIDALALCETLMLGKMPRDRQIGAYWKAVILVHLGYPDTSEALLRAYRGNWGGLIRETNAEALLLTLKRKVNTSPPPCPEPSLGPAEKNAIQHSENVEKRNTELQTEVGRLQAENIRYEKLLGELDRLH